MTAWRIRYNAATQVGEWDIHPRAVKQLHNRHTYISTHRTGSSDTAAPSVEPNCDTEDGEEKKVIETPATLGDAAVSAASEADQVMSSSPSVAPGTRKYDKWSAEAQQEFTRLYAQHRGKQRTHEFFMSLWDVDRYGAVDDERWSTRNLTESRRLKSGAVRQKKRARLTVS